MHIPNNTLNTALLNFLTNQETICAQYRDAYIVLYDTQILGPFKTVTQAYREAFARYEIGTFLIKYCGDLKD